MNKKRHRLAGLAVAGCLLAACGHSGQAAAAEQKDRLLVCASFYTMAEFAEQVAGDRAEVVNLIPSGGEPHDWEPAPKDMGNLEEADVLILNGGGFEHWADGVLPTLQNQDLLVVDTTANLTLLEGHGHDGVDPHVWLSPVMAQKQVEAIRDGLIAADPEGEEDYRRNSGAFLEELEQLGVEFRQTLEVLPGRDIVVAHAAFAYLCAEYGLTQVAVQGLSPEGEPDPAQMARVIEHAKKKPVKVVFFEETASTKVAETIAREIGAQTAVLSTLEGLSQEQEAAGEGYVAVMRQNLEQLKAALA